MEAHRRVKGAFDPEGRLNPGNLVDPAPIDEDWRVEPGVEPPDHDTYFDWSADGGLLRAAEKCNGAGTCRRRAEAGGTMCPSYRATLDEEDTTRGRANVLRQLLRDAEPDEAFTSDDVERALDLCLSCKACKTECPASVDMARLKAEYTQQRYDREGAPWSAWFFAHYRTAARLASVAPTLANFVLTFALTRWLIDRLGSLDPDRELPEFASERFTRQFRRRETPDDAHERPVVWLYVDPFTEFNDPEVGMAAVRVLEAGGYRVERFPVDDDGRTFLSKGFVDRAKKLADRNLERVGPLLEEHPERSVVGVEPSALLTFRDELPDLASPERRGAAEELADRALLFEEFVERACLEGGFGAPWPEDAGGRVELHGHCHQEALAGTEATERVLSIAGYEVDVIDSGCCGMAGSFGYEADHADVSREIGELTLFPAVRDMDEETRLAAPGFSCRHQIDDETDRSAAHPAVLLDEALERGTGNRE
ncbi:MAG: (Fe-S)-binding protein [Bradymonadaceae bacterium]